MFGINGWEFVGLAVVALVVLGPDKLPRFAADAARMLRQLRSMANAARDDVRRELGPEFSDISLDDLAPRNLLRKHVLDPDELDPGVDDRRTRRPPPSRPNGASPAAEPGGASPAAPAPYDPDAT